MRPEQFNRYFSLSDAKTTTEDTIEDEVPFADDPFHKNWDEYVSGVPPGTHYASSQKGVPGCKRRPNERLGCSRNPFIEPIGQTRERFYEIKATLGLSWYCPEKPVVEADGSTTWTFQWDPPPGVAVEGETLVLGKNNPVSFEETCNRLENRFCQPELVCDCCALDAVESVCRSCRHSVGFHRCEKRAGMVWRKGSLHAGVLDIQRAPWPALFVLSAAFARGRKHICMPFARNEVLFNLHRKPLT